MCGISGFFNPTGVAENRGRRIGLAMAQSLAHRGPDAAGCWVDPGAGVVLSHRRLAIVDLSDAGNQPMESECGRYIVVYNGEVYNHLELRRDIDDSGPPGRWRGHSDTETLLSGVTRWGLSETLRRSTGMFALALWDKKKRSLSLARDRFGEKPLYYGWQGGGHDRAMLFASEPIAFHHHPTFSPRLSPNALSQFLRYGYVPAPASIFEGIAKLSPGTIATWHGRDVPPQVEHYWDTAEAAQRGASAPFSGSPDEAASKVEELLARSISRQMIADVPLGAFLSGGVDSSTVVALMQARSSRPVRTFTIGFGSKGYDEAKDAAAVAAHLKTDHTELYVSPSDALAVIPSLPAIYSEPFADSSQIPTFLVSRMARRDVTVALSGDGGDEVFCGYNRYIFTKRLWTRISRLPGPARRAAASALAAVPVQTWSAVGNRFAASRVHQLGDKVHKGAALISAASIDELYARIVRFPNVDHLLKDDRFDDFTYPGSAVPGLTDVERMMCWDSTQYLPDDILVKVDRAAMAVSLETRVPILDHDVMQFAWTLTDDIRLHDGVSKWPLRAILRKYVPDSLIDRPKMGFGVPIAEWLRGPLREWGGDLLSDALGSSDDLFDPAATQQLWKEHQSGRRNWAAQLWTLLMFQSWSNAQVTPVRAAA